LFDVEILLEDLLKEGKWIDHTIKLLAYSKTAQPANVLKQNKTKITPTFRPVDDKPFIRIWQPY